MADEREELSRSVFRRFGGWLLAVLAAVVVALAVDWSKFVAGPTKGLDPEREVEFFAMHGMTVRCSIPVLRYNFTRHLDETTVEVAYVAVQAALLHTALYSGEAETRYICYFTDARFHSEVYLPNSPTESDDGQQCREVRITQTSFIDEDEFFLFLEDEVDTYSDTYCLDVRGQWQRKGRKYIGRGPR